MPERGRTEIRRRDRAGDDAWTRDFIRQARVGVLAMTRGEQPLVNSNLFVYDPGRHAIYIHTARTGLTRDNLSRPAPVCFSAFEMGRLLPADEALEFSVEFASATAFGTGGLVEDPAEARAALQMLLDKYAPELRPGRDYRPITEGELRRTSVYRIDIEEWTGKLKLVEDGFPGAFHVPPPDIFPRAR
ncbi:MAG: pyridoxamine 5'-phosphate oxidase family protein [Gammaproteobacteria bacterium]|nr:pyridoxamine 5'-phosphate oxidase family protein [Gammaproteobacteria bacterium]